MSEDTVMTIRENGVYGKVLRDKYPTDPRTMMDCASTLLGLAPLTECYSDKHASRYNLLCEVRRHPRYCGNWENEYHRAFRDFSDIEVLLDTARQLGFLIVPMDPAACVFGGFGDPVEPAHDMVFYMSPEKIHEEWGKGPAAYRKARNYMLCEIDEYISYLQGDVFGAEVGTYHVDHDDPNADEDGVVLHETHAEEVWGLVGLEWAEAEMNSMIHGLQKHLSSITPVVVKPAA